MAAGLSMPASSAPGEAHDADTHRLWYRQPAVKWTEALPVGNGRAGAMVFGGVARERLQLNEDTLWSGGRYHPVNPAARAALPEVRRLIFAGRYAEAQALADATLMAKPLKQMAYQTAGDLFIDMPQFVETDIRDYERELDLDAACASTRFVANGTHFRRDVVACAIRQVIAVRLSADRSGAISCEVSLTSPLQRALTVDGDTIVLSGRNGDKEGVASALRFEVRARVIARGGASTARDGKIGVQGADEVTLLIAMATSFRRFDDVSGDPAAITRTRLDAARAHDFMTIAAQAAAEHRRLYRGVQLDLGRTDAANQPTDLRIQASEQANDPALATLYFNYARYLLICASRPKSQPANLQGIWNDSLDPPWGSKYTININTEMNYWPAEVTGLAECTAPLIEMIRELAESGARTAREMYGARGWVAHHNTDLWRATAPIDGAQWGLWPTGGAWLCTHLWTRYEYGRDVKWLATVYPLMRGAAEFFVDVLQRDPSTGFLVTNPSISPENRHPQGASVCAGPAMDMQILRDLFEQTAAAADILAIDAPFAAQIRTLREQLAPDKVGALGQLQEWQEDWDAAAPERDHRHVSHLYGLYPSHQINLRDTPALAAAARRSLELRGDQSTGWATAWRINLWARLGDGDHAHRILKFLLGPGRTYPNMFDAHPPFQIDGNFGGAAAIAEMLLQSRGDELLLLPALPKAWPTGSVRGLRAKGACTVDLHWRAGLLRHADLVSAIGGVYRVHLGERSVTVTLQPGRPVRLIGVALRVRRSG
ncbi:glycoside hydrolase family 95 protein [Sphingomonas sp. HF-S4]|uniref:Glycoside hydrolase family 95 protein n=1 Tax=Sphingomonas agrestis TaxID=3080540 RepID=A0ABU3Y6M1_9SPHN|nr:glycoside hydrolase family 95 protein [Sphingomonas sp. HF-S4]MDV3457078.1 glycoside hydrolase family 95 protein [Sphingomonas sp. HF-S4]